ncbi:MAG: ribose-5-phosphate isomerase RpiA [Pirellulaceae bacterium]|nr:ribose-5-phosphate isomerase RpiA [Pirellulaceae bacterium]
MSAGPTLDAISRRALDYIAAGNVVGLGTGRAATGFIQILGERVRGGLKIRGVPTSQASDDLARQLGIPLVTLDDVPVLDVTVDGADEVAPDCNVIKGYGGALVREKIVAAASKKLVILVGEEKLVPTLGARGKLPVEALPFGLGATIRHLTALGLSPVVRQTGGKTFITDNGNVVLDCGTGPIVQPAELEAAVRAIPGVVGTGLFLGMADVVLIQHGEDVEVRTSQKGKR